MPIATIEHRLAGVIGQLVVDNAALGVEVEKLRAELIKEQGRNNELQQQLEQLAVEPNFG